MFCNKEIRQLTHLNTKTTILLYYLLKITLAESAGDWDLNNYTKLKPTISNAKLKRLKLATFLSLFGLF